MFLMVYNTNNECFSFVRWYRYFHFASLNRTFNLSPHENIRTIALVTIHYLYNNHSYL